MKQWTLAVLVLTSSLIAAIPANAATCAGKRAQCVAGCPAAMKVGAPAGCTCESRYSTCMSTKVWPSWRAGAAGTPVTK
jgi:hypothetical protein